MQSENFDPNAFVVLKPEQPIFLDMYNPFKANIIISSVGLRWNSFKNRVVNSSYRLLFDYLMEGLPIERKFRGGVFYAQVHSGKLSPWEDNPNFDLASAIFHSFKGADNLCAKNLRITLGEYAGDSLRSAVITLKKRRVGV